MLHLTFRDLNLSRADLRGADLRGASIDHHKLKHLAGRAWRSDGYEFLIFSLEDGSAIIRAGCRTFTVDEFTAHVDREYPDTPKATETMRILAFLEAQEAAEPW